MYFTIIYNIVDDKTSIKYFDTLYDRVVFDKVIQKSDSLFSLGNEQTHPQYAKKNERKGRVR